MSVPDTSEITLGKIVKFKTINPHDNVQWVGRITGLCEFPEAEVFADVLPYYNEIKRANPTLAAKEKLQYFILTVAENNTVKTKRVFALEWLDLSSVEFLAEDTHIDIRIYDTSVNTAAELLRTIKSLGYMAEIVK